ncbi:PepSY domain-containing protein [Enterococcus faecalis]|nr:peptidase M4 [Enterococcus faecalis]EHB5063318.1 peptidase M4 [Enterococcus faecalis]EHZ5707566.1 PepSY domain-containing protein [Enterococcus faecalis]EKG8969550.1 PepSY domain-containing protein [Enterococcus faecalis]EKZ0142218.1 PepSY domain-containing protein [Enterococcus faecalis]
MLNKKKRGNFMLKKPFLLFFSLLGAIFILASCGIGKDAVTDTKYKVSLQQAAEIYEKEAGNNKPLVNVQFDTEPASDYSYIFTNETETLYVNPETGKVTKNTEANQLGENETAFSATEVKELGAVNDVLAKAKKEVGGLSPRILTWKLTKNNNKLVYTVDVKTTTADEKVTLDANK